MGCIYCVSTTATTEINALSIHAARPSCALDRRGGGFKEGPASERVLIGCGTVQPRPAAALRLGLSEAGVVADFMNSGAACRTFNVLLAEGRRVAAALIAVE